VVGWGGVGGGGGDSHISIFSKSVVMTLSDEFKYFIFDTESAIGLEHGILKFLANHKATG